jgi:hypothetical protein
MSEVLVILEPSITDSDRQAVRRAAPPTQSISNRVFTANATESALPRLRSMPGVSNIIGGAEQGRNLPQLDDAESLFVEAWLSRRGQVKQRRGDGLDWDTPPMLPPDPKR